MSVKFHFAITSNDC